MTRRQRVVAPPPGMATLADSLPPRIDPPTVRGDMAALALDLAPTPGADRLTSLHPLPEGTRLLDYEIVGLLGEGGFGIVYLAYDALLERHVAIKEYLPAVLASRATSQAVMVKSERHADAFRTGLRSFVNEARLLARFDHPSLVKVLRFWEGNGTAYMAMPFYEGPTLSHHLQTLGRSPTEDELLGWLQPLLHALSTLHAVRCYHRDIAPDNILLTPAGPLLLDFGAARRVVGQAVASPTVVIKPGYAPIEQYGEAPTLKQGPWTDLYALAGVVHAAIAGAPPTPAVERWIEDRHRPLSRSAHHGYSAHFLEAIDAALALRPADRPASAAAFWKRLNGPNALHASWSAAAPQTALVAPVEMDVDIAPDTAPAPLEAPQPELVAQAPAVATVLLEPEPEPELEAVPVPQPSSIDLPTPTFMSEAPPPRKPWWLLALAALLLIVVGVWAFDIWRAAPAPSAWPASLPPPREAPPATASAAAPQPTPTPATPATPAAPAVSAPEAKPATPRPTPAPAPAAAPREPAPALARPTREAASPAAAASTTESSRRCSELLQRASLETLRPAELSFLTRECRP